MGLSQLDWKIFDVPLVAVLAAVAGGFMFTWVSAYVAIAPRLRKIRLSRWLGRGSKK